MSELDDARARLLGAFRRRNGQLAAARARDRLARGLQAQREQPGGGASLVAELMRGAAFGSIAASLHDPRPMTPERARDVLVAMQLLEGADELDELAAEQRRRFQ